METSDEKKPKNARREKRREQRSQRFRNRFSSAAFAFSATLCERGCPFTL
jgi:2-iminoacetate synthase ThiH